MSSTPDSPDEATQRFAPIRDDFTRLMLGYRFGMEQVALRLEILREESAELRADIPIEHISTRMKTPESILAKANKQGTELATDAIREGITDIAGVRVICSFVADVYRIVESLTTQPDLTVQVVKDYIAHPKATGYRSLHVIVEVPVYLSSGAIHVPVEVQLRTVAMDFWASTEQKILYKYEGDIPADLRQRITAAAATAARMDEEMAELHQAVHGARYQ